MPTLQVHFMISVQYVTAKQAGKTEINTVMAHSGKAVHQQIFSNYCNYQIAQLMSSYILLASK
jgi:hypothetical protein